jgi:RND family efflux transporter MFP subunit
MAFEPVRATHAAVIVPPRARRLLRASGSACVIAAALATAACREAPPPPKAEVRPVRSVVVQSRPADDVVSLTGTVQPQTEINFSFRIDGRMVERRVEVGNQVRVGQVLAVLNPDNEQDSVRQAEANLAAARARATEARNTLERNRPLLAQGFISKAAFDNLQATATATQAQADAAQAQVSLASNRLGYTNLVADAPGIVTAIGAEPGEIVQAGRSIVQIARQGGRDAVFDVPPAIKDSAPSNPNITVTLASDPKVSAAGTVREVSPRADPATGTFRVRVSLANPPERMRLGTTVTGRMKVDNPGGMEIPASALTNSDKQPAVWVVDPKTETVSMRSIEVGRFEQNRVMVAKGLQDGEIVVTAGVQALRPGQKVRLLKATP